MKRELSIKLLNAVWAFIPGSLMAVISVIFVSSPGYGAERLVVQDIGGQPAFVVTEEGRVGVGTQTPIMILDVSGGGVLRSQLHFSLSGTDTGGWVTSVADNNFWLSSGAMYDSSATGWVQKSPDGLAVMAGSGPAGYRVITRSGCAVGTVCPPVTRLTVNYSGQVGIGVTPSHLLHLAGGAYSDGLTWVNGSSREYKDNIRDLTTEEALSAFQGLNPVAFTYKAGEGERHIGFIAEDVPELVATRDRKGLSPMDIVAVLTKVVQEQRKEIEEQKRVAEEQKKEYLKTLSVLSERMDELERALQLGKTLAAVK